MGLIRLKGRSIVCAAVAVVLCMAAQPGRAWAQSDSAAAERAEALWQQGYAYHRLGAYEHAAQVFQLSIEARPTAKGHTFLGWSLSELGRFEAAIAECKKAIAIDPDYGNPYNDIGVYLIQLGRADEAIPWFRKAMRAKRYCCHQFPHVNLGQVLLEKGKVREAKILFERALKYDPDYAPAQEALEEISRTWL